MGEKYLGCLLSIDCGDILGYYQGEVCRVDTASQTLTIKDVFHNGLKSPIPEITLHAKDIVNLSIISSTKDEKFKKIEAHSGIGRTESPHHKGHQQQARDSPRKFVSYVHSVSPSVGQVAPETPIKGKKNARGKPLGKDDVCFGSNIDMEQEFDFEGNLALFDKKTVMGEIQASKQGSIGCPNVKTVPKYRPDENVLESAPPLYRQIHLPFTSAKEFLTDSGLVVPCVTPSVKKSLADTMDKLGIGIERRSETIARAVAEMALHLVGGPHRLTPKNSHQKPVVVVLCGNHPEAAGAVCAARHLATLGVQTVVYFHGSSLTSYLKKEMELYKLTGHAIINSEKNLPRDTVDLILAALLPPTYTGGEISGMKGIIDWANKLRAPTVAIDQPPVSIVPSPWLQIKCSLTSDLPLAYGPGDGKLYLYALGTPRKVFQTLGIEYDSPFGSKFVITLHESS